MALDPVCMMDIDSVTAEAQSQYEGETVYFCSEECKRIFEADPEPYLDEIETAADRTGQES
jgi:YHS domain-containing protein